MVRIRYTQDGPYLVTKQKYILPTGQIVFGQIDPRSPFDVKIQEVDRDVSHFTKTEPTLKDAKIAVKSALKALGIEFGTELRVSKEVVNAAVQTELEAIKQ